MTANLPKAFIFGAGAVGKSILPSVLPQYHVLAFLENDKTKWNQPFEGFPVLDPKSVLETDFDKIIIASQAGMNSITEQLLDLGIDRNKISTDYVIFTVQSRIVFLEKLSEVFHGKGIQGCVAECGVFQGEFAREINRVFPTHKLYLFDTFSGFDARDAEIEQENQYSAFGAGHFKITNEELVTSKLPHPDMCVIKKGYFPDTAKDLEEDFCFVNLDFDLYKPTLEGLKYFVPRMVKGGVILIHDYFSPFLGVKEAVAHFEAAEKRLSFLPIGDALSIAVHF